MRDSATWKSQDGREKQSAIKRRERETSEDLLYKWNLTWIMKRSSLGPSGWVCGPIRRWPSISGKGRSGKSYSVFPDSFHCFGEGTGNVLRISPVLNVPTRVYLFWGLRALKIFWKWDLSQCTRVCPENTLPDSSKVLSTLQDPHCLLVQQQTHIYSLVWAG